MGMFVVANILGSTIQISTLPLPVLSTLQAAGLVFNSICATLILNEPFTRWSFSGTVLVTSGAALIAIFGAIPSPAHSLKELIELLGGRGFIIWMSLQVVFVVAVATTVDLINYLTKWSNDIRFRLVRGLTYGCISGILSAHSLLFAKSAVELILRTIADGENQFVHWQSWLLVLGLVVLALSQLYYLHRGLKLVSTSVLYPLVFCIYNIIAILDGLIYFQQTSFITPLHGGLIALGTVVLLSGVLALSWRLSDEQHPPAVGQSSLTPGLGLVDDTEGEEEEDSLLGVDSDTMSDEEGRVPPAYNTFAPGAERPGLTPSHKTANPWLERTEIWDELDDQETASLPPLSATHPPPGPTPGETVPLLLPRHRRGVSHDSTHSSLTTLTTPPPPQQQLQHSVSSAAAADDAAHSLSLSAAPAVPRRMFRRRRKSTGFPGFKARTHERRKSGASGSGGGGGGGGSGSGDGGGSVTPQDAVGGFWKLRWWRERQHEEEEDGREEETNDAVDNRNDGPSSSTLAAAAGHQRYRDEEPEAGAGDSPRSLEPPPARDRGGRDRGGGGERGDDLV